MLIIVIGGAVLAWKSGILNNITGGLGGGGGGNSVEVSQDGMGTDIDVAGNGCACANGKCKGNCGAGNYAGQLPAGMSPKEFVKSKVPQAYYTKASPFRTVWGYYY